jgi:putative transposase
VQKTFKYRLYPTAKQAALLDQQLAEACRLYNAALQGRRDAWKMRKTSITYYQQCSQLRDIRAGGDLHLANYTSCQDVLRRVDKAFQGFFRRSKQGKKAGYPRFKPLTRFQSYTFPIYGNGCKLRERRLYIHGIGDLKVKLHRPVAGHIKTVTLKKSCGKWDVCFSVIVPSPDPLPETGNATGIDVGITSFAVLSDGTTIKIPAITKQHRPSFAGCNERYPGGKEPAIDAGRLSSSLPEFTTISRTSAVISTTKWHGN